MDEPEAEYLTADEAARRLGIKRATLYAYVSRGLIESFRQGIKRDASTGADVERLLHVAPSGAGASAARSASPPRLREWRSCSLNLAST
jgi:citrate synthase